MSESRRESRDTGKSDRRDRRDRDKDRRKDRHRHRHGRPKKTPIQLDKSQNEALLGALADAEKTAEQEEVFFVICLKLISKIDFGFVGKKKYRLIMLENLCY